jgi:hypothetical protein
MAPAENVMRCAWFKQDKKIEGLAWRVARRNSCRQLDQNRLHNPRPSRLGKETAGDEPR